MTEDIKSLEPNGKATEEIRKERDDFLENVATKCHVLLRNITFQFWGVTFKVENEDVCIRKFNTQSKVFISKANKRTELTDRITKQFFKTSDFDSLVILARRNSKKKIKATKIVIVDGEWRAYEEIYTSTNEILLSKILPSELQDEAQKLMRS